MLNNLTYGNSAIANDDPLLTLYTGLGSINITGDLIDASNTGTTLVIAGDRRSRSTGSRHRPDYDQRQHARRRLDAHR